jgi:hypothetical protein
VARVLIRDSQYVVSGENVKKKAILMITILLVISMVVVGAAWYFSLGRTSPMGMVPTGSFVNVEVDNNRTINLTFKSEVGSAIYQDCRLLIMDSQGVQYSWNLTGITWTNNEAKNDSVIPGIELRIIRSNGQTTFSTGNLVELESSSGMLAKGNWVITLNFRPTGGTIASRTIVV